MSLAFCLVIKDRLVQCHSLMQFRHVSRLVDSLHLTKDLNKSPVKISVSILNLTNR